MGFSNPVANLLFGMIGFSNHVLNSLGGMMGYCVPSFWDDGL